MTQQDFMKWMCRNFGSDRRKLDTRKKIGNQLKCAAAIGVCRTTVCKAAKKDVIPPDLVKKIIRFELAKSASVVPPEMHGRDRALDPFNRFMADIIQRENFNLEKAVKLCKQYLKVTKA
jgi:DICT domain-containing protein